NEEIRQSQLNRVGNDIVDAAEKIFFEKGLNNSTMDEVAKEAELSKGTLYLYFKSKEEIHFEIKIRALNILKNMFQDSISEKKNGFENCIEIGKTYVDFVKKHSNYYKAIIHFESNDCSICEFRDKCENFFREDNPLKFFVQTISQGITDGTIRNDIPANVLAQMLWAQTNGILQFISTKQIILEFAGVEAEDIINSQFKIIGKGLKKD
ncbi:MAG: TetR/AcrR family transcriptional regulator, partial [Bacteroidales bacterium]|nr:TetR/AcrR family transcriptional regulator [Bacteroidales bacterium]